MKSGKFKKIAVTGGKGGTGKSTFSILLANQMIRKGKKVVLSDCDVECPNDHLLLGKKLGKINKKVYAEFPELIKEKCTKCGLCAKTCRSNAIFQAPGEYPVFIKELCSGCGACWTVCPFGAIRPKKEEIGGIYLNKIKDSFFLVSGIAKPGLEETGPIVRETKEFGFKIAEKEKADLVIIDTAAGTHCSVINALMGVDFAYAVSEPTLMGAYDLKLILSLIEKLKIPVEIILNQADLGDKKIIEKAAEDYGTKIKREIPYSKEIAEAYSKGQLINYE